MPCWIWGWGWLLKDRRQCTDRIKRPPLVLSFNWEKSTGYYSDNFLRCIQKETITKKHQQKHRRLFLCPSLVFTGILSRPRLFRSALHMKKEVGEREMPTRQFYLFALLCMERRTLPFGWLLVEHIGRTISGVLLRVLLLSAEAEFLVLVFQSTIRLRTRREMVWPKTRSRQLYPRLSGLPLVLPPNFFRSPKDSSISSEPTFFPRL